MSDTTGSEPLSHEGELFERSRVPTLVLDLNARSIRAANTAMEQFLGLPREQIIGRPGSDFVTEEVADMLRKRGLRSATTGTARAILTEGGPRIAEVTMTPSSEEGVMFVQLLDLTGLAPDSTLSAHQSLDAGRVLDASPAATIVVDLPTRAITRVNPSATALLGTSETQAIGRPVPDFGVGGEDLEGLLTALDDDETGAAHSLVTMLHTSQGDRAVEITAVGLLDTPSAVLHLEVAGTSRPTRRRRRTGAHTIGDAVEPKTRRRIQIACGAAVAVLGAIVLGIGWWLGVDSVTRIAPDLASMKVNTAVGFLVIGAALLTPKTERYGRVQSVLWSLLLVIGALTTIEYALDLDFGVDELLAAETDLTATSSPGRMGFNTALCFAAIGLGAPLSGSRRTWRQTVAGQVLIISAAGLALLALLAYMFGATGSRGIASSTEMALHTSVAVIVATFGLLSTQLDRGVIAPLGEPFAGGRFARRIMPIGIGLVFASGLVAQRLTTGENQTDPDLELAFFALVVSASLFVVVLAVTRQTNALDAIAARSRRDLSAVMAAFSDRHYRVDNEGNAIAVTGAQIAHHVPVDDLVPPAFRDRLESAVAASRTERRVTELTFTPEDGEGRRELRIAPLDSQEVAVSVRDVSELAAARDALAELTRSLEDDVRARTAELEGANEELERSNSDLEQFAYLASHDLQEPLRMVSTFVDKLARRLGDELDDRSAQYVSFAVDGAERMSDLIDGLLQYSRAGRDAGNPGPVDLDSVVPSVLQGLSERVTEQDATIEIADDLPSVWADEVLLRQILQNLLGNALKFNDPARPGRVRVDARRVGTTVEIGVADNGVGIPPEFRDQVFLMFRRLHARTSYAGTGIGLSLVQRLVESQGGRVWIDDDHGPDGVRFVFTVPASPHTSETTR